MELITPREVPAAVWAHALSFAGTGRGKNVRRIYAATLVPVMALYVAWMFPHIYRLDRATYVQIRGRHGGQRPRHLIPSVLHCSWPGRTQWGRSPQPSSSSSLSTW